MTKKINKIQLIIKLKGQGLVNYNGNRVPARFFNQMFIDGKASENGSFGKENLYTEEIIDDKGSKKKIDVPKKIISHNLLRKCIVGDENSVNSDRLMNNQKLRVSYLSQDNVIAKGFASLGKSLSLKRKGAISVLDAEQISNTKTWLETKTAEGIRDSNSLFYKETCGKIEYESEILFDIKQMHFISTDDNYDRMSLAESDVEGFIKHIDSRYGPGNAIYGNWGTTHLNLMGEQGILLSKKVVKNIIRYVISRVFEIDIRRAGSYAKIDSIKIAFGYEGDKIDLLINPNFVEINSIDEYDKLADGMEIGFDFINIEPPRIEKIEKVVKVK